MATPKFIPYSAYREFPEEEMLRRSEEFYELANRRRTVRTFSDRNVDKRIIENAIHSAGTAPSGANMQPWKYIAISSAEIKSKIRIAAEQEEREFYANKAPKEWLDALAPLGTDDNKPFLERAPWLIAIFAEKYGKLSDGRLVRHYYVQESVGISTGILIMALHNAGLATLTHTPSPMSFLNEILERPDNERPYLLIVTGYPDENTTIPDIQRKKLHEISEFIV